jgi:hypothetical protein
MGAATAVAVIVLAFLVVVAATAVTVIVLAFLIVVAAFAVATFAAAATAALVNMAMCDLILSRRANFLHSNIEVEVLARERMVTIYSDVFVVDFNHTNRYWTLISASLKLHADFERLNALKAVARHDLFQCRIRRTVAVFRGDTHFNFIASGFTDESGFETGDDVFVPVEIGQWLTRLRLIEYCSFVVFKRVVHSDDCSFCDLHNVL